MARPGTAHASPAFAPRPLDKDLRGYLASNADCVTRISKQVSIDQIGALSAQSEQPILFENIAEKPGFRVCDILVKHRKLQARALGVAPEDYLRTLAYRLRLPPRGLVTVKTGPVKEVVWLGNQADLTKLPIPFHTAKDEAPYLTAMNILRDPETGFYNSSHAGTLIKGPRQAFPSFATPHSVAIIEKYRAMGADWMPMAYVLGVPPAYEIMANFSGLHMDMWGEMEMVGTLMDQDIEMVPCESIDLSVPAQAEMVIEGKVHLKARQRTGEIVAPSMYHLPHYDNCLEFEATAITMRADRPIYRNHQTCPETDHQILPRLCHEAMIYNRLTELGLKVADVRFPAWGGVFSCIFAADYPRDGFVNDALMAVMGAPWLNTKMVVAVSPDTDLESAAAVYHAIATRCDPARDLFVVPGTRGSPYDPSAAPLTSAYPFRITGKLGIDATIKSRHDRADFERAWPKNWTEVNLRDFL